MPCEREGRDGAGRTSASREVVRRRDELPRLPSSADFFGTDNQAAGRVPPRPALLLPRTPLHPPWLAVFTGSRGCSTLARGSRPGGGCGCGTRCGAAGRAAGPGAGAGRSLTAVSSPKPSPDPGGCLPPCVLGHHSLHFRL